MIKNVDKYIEKISEHVRNSDTCIIILCFNQRQAIEKNIEFYANLEIDVCYLDNQSTDGTLEFLSEHSGKFNIIHLRDNYGGAGGFCVGMQWVIERGYDYCIITEDDATPISEDIVTALVEKRKCGVVRSSFLEFGRHANSLHFTSYPVKIFKDIGVLNKNLFFRADDWEWGQKVKRYCKENRIPIIIIDKYYSHKVIKKGFGLFSLYFTIRNSLLVHSKYPIINPFLDVFKIFYMYLTFAIFQFLQNKNRLTLNIFFCAFYDYLKSDLSLNKKRLLQFSQMTLTPSSGAVSESATIDEFKKKYRNYTYLILGGNENRMTIFSDVRSGLSENIVTFKFVAVSQVLAMVAKHIIFVEDIDYKNNSIQYFEYSNNGYYLTRIKIIISLLVGLLTTFILSGIIGFKVLTIFFKKERRLILN